MSGTNRGISAGRASTVRLSVRWEGMGSFSVGCSRVRQAASRPQSASRSTGSSLRSGFLGEVFTVVCQYGKKSVAALKGTASNGCVLSGDRSHKGSPCNGFKTHHQRFQSHGGGLNGLELPALQATGAPCGAPPSPPLRYNRAHDIKDAGASYVACKFFRVLNPGT